MIECGVATLSGSGSRVKIGVIGGTFDPVHNGHLGIAEETRNQLALTEILFVPAGKPWLKARLPVSSVEQRVDMVRLAIASSPYCKLSTVEIDRPGPSYTVDTVTELRNQLGAGTELFFILGWDSLAELPQWHQPSRLTTESLSGQWCWKRHRLVTVA